LARRFQLELLQFQPHLNHLSMLQELDQNFSCFLQPKQTICCDFLICAIWFLKIEVVMEVYTCLVVILSLKIDKNLISFSSIKYYFRSISAIVSKLIYQVAILFYLPWNSKGWPLKYKMMKQMYKAKIRLQEMW